MERQQITLLVVVAGIMPLAWGWSVHWLLMKVWPQRRPWQRSVGPAVGPAGGENARAAPPLDYQI